MPDTRIGSLVLDLAPIKLPAGDAAFARAGAVEELPDAATTAYVLATRDAFETLRLITAQFAGLLVLAATGVRGWRTHPMFAVMVDEYDAAADTIRAVAVPARARHCHAHALAALGKLREALTHVRGHAASRGTQSPNPLTDLALAALKEASGELERSSAAIPGLGGIDFAQGCCAIHQRVGN